MVSTIRKTKFAFKIIIGFLLITLILLMVFKFGRYVNGANNIPTPIPSLIYDGCSDHEGVNCSILNPDASVVCNDGTIDESFVIYAVPQCQKTIENISKQESAFMAKSGCIPPGEMACINEESYRNLLNKLTSSGLNDSELGKNELAECRKQTQDYATKNADFRQCLAENNNPQLNLSGNRLFLPIFKAVFCPIFYGEHATYDYDSNLCLCDEGYFMSNTSETGLSNKQCVNASLICQSKYGPGTSAQNGNCYCEKGYKFNNNRTYCIPQNQPPLKLFFSPIKKSLTTQPDIIYSPTIQPYPPLATKALESPQTLSPTNHLTTTSSSSDTNVNFIIRTLNAFLSGIKKIFNLP